MSTGVKAHVAGSCGCKAGWFEMFPSGFARSHKAKLHRCEGSCCRTSWEVLRVLSAFDAWWHANNPLLGATTCPLV